MTPAQIIHTQYKIYKLLSAKRLKDAFALLATLNYQLQDWKYQHDAEETETSYRYMLRYMLEGVEDPERDKIYNGLILNAYSLTDKVSDRLLARESASLYYSRKRFIDSYLKEGIHKFADKAEEILSSLSLNELLQENQTPEEKYRLHCELERSLSDLFLSVWTNYPATTEQVEEIKNILLSGKYSQTVINLVISALLLNLLHRYDERKLQLLLETYRDTTPIISKRALTAALIVLYVYRERVALSPVLPPMLESFAENAEFADDVLHIFLQFIRSRETEKIAKKLTEELFSKIARIDPSLYKKLGQDQVMNDMSSFDKNPEWQEILEQAGVTEQLKELNDLQMEGADVFMSTFSHLKSFAFFNDLSNWFIPFSTDHSALQTVFTDNPKEKTFRKIMEYSNFLCNSDKYSFCLSLSQVSQAQREMMISQFNIEGADLEEFEKEDMLEKMAGKNENFSKQYIQDLYRFFKLHPHRLEFTDPFNTALNLWEIEPLRSVFSDPEKQRLIAEAFFKKEYYNEALEIFAQLLRNDHSNSELYQKAGYCLQMTERYQEALESYLKAEMIYPDSFWTLKHIASCYRTLKQPAQALEYYLRALQLKPDNLAVEMNVGHCYLEQKKYTEALQHYFKVDYLDPKSSRAWRPIAWCSFLSGKKEQAQRYYEKIIDEKPTPQDFLNAGHVEFSLNHIRQALVYYQKSIAAGGNQLESFLQAFRQDLPDLIAAGISPGDIPVVLDELMYSNLPE